MQLQGLLSSLKANCNIFNRIVVIYDFSDKEYEQAYNELKNEQGIIWLYGNISFKDRVLSAFGDTKYTCFMVDDLIAYTEIEKEPIKEMKMLMETGNIFSLRIGKNIGKYQQGEFMQDNHYEHSFIFDWTQQKKYWGYPFSVDGHVFRTDFIKTIIQNGEFHNPNKLEIILQRGKDIAPKYMSCFNQSVVVSIPINRVSITASASFGERYPHTAKELNDKFLAGERMDWQAMDFSDIKSSHQEVELKFKTI